jgi:hypothetical protein
LLHALLDPLLDVARPAPIASSSVTRATTERIALSATSLIVVSGSAIRKA